MSSAEFTGANPADALQLRQAILSVDPDLWSQSRPDEIMYPQHATLIGWDTVPVAELPEATRRRLLVTPDSDQGNYEVLVGRHSHPEWWKKEGDERFIDHGPNAAFLRVSRVDFDRRIRVASHFRLNVTEAYNPDQPPLCDVAVETSDESSYYDLLDMLNKNQAGLDDLVVAMGGDPLKDFDDQPPLNLDLPDAELEIKLYRQLVGEDMDEAVANTLRIKYEAKKGLRELEDVLGANQAASEELVTLAGLVHKTQFGINF